MTEKSEALPRDLAAIDAMAKDPAMRAASEAFLEHSIAHHYSYNFSWLGRPIIQYPQDIVALQEIVWKTRPDVIVETGIARGGSLVLFASILELIGGAGKVVGVDIDIREHNKVEIEAHPLAKRITMVQGSSIDPVIVEKVRRLIRQGARTMVVLDSNHTEEHVLEELRAYAPLVSPQCYLAVLDTVVENLPARYSADRPWGPGNNPMTALDRFLAENDDFSLDEEYDKKLLLTVAPRGYLVRR